MATTGAGRCVVVVHATIKAGHMDEFLPKLMANVHGARTAEPGCRQFDVSRDPTEPNKLIFYEVYDNEAAFAAHQETPHFKTFVATALDHIESRARVNYEQVEL